MRRKREWGITLGLALAVAASISMVSLAKEERQKVGTIELSFSLDTSCCNCFYKGVLGGRRQAEGGGVAVS